MIDFLHELGNFKQKKFTLQNVNFFTYYNNRPYIPHFVFRNLRHPMVQKILDIYRALILCNVKMPAACPPLTFFYFYVNYTPEKQMYYCCYKLHSFITLLNHKIAIWWSFFSVSTYVYWHQALRLVWCGQPEKTSLYLYFMI